MKLVQKTILNSSLSFICAGNNYHKYNFLELIEIVAISSKITYIECQLI